VSLAGNIPAPARAGGRWAAGDRAALAGAIVVAAIALVALVGPSLLAHDPLRQDLLALNAPPSAAHWLGTDSLGRDVLARLVEGARTTLLVGIGGAAFAFLAGAGVGLGALALGGPAPLLVYGAIDLIRVLPGMLMVLLLIVAIGSGALAVTLAVGLTFAPLVAYFARAAWMREVQQDYVAAARSFGYGRLYILGRHVAPNIAGALVTQAAIVLPRCIVTESVVSFLGLGATPDQPTWGRMISDAARFAERAPHAVLAPLLALVALTLALSFVGDRLRLRLDPLRRARPEDGR
jgi:ABC-type dipeptide/oligopeptide/nickel transport system permease subunit